MRVNNRHLNKTSCRPGRAQHKIFYFLNGQQSQWKSLSARKRLKPVYFKKSLLLNQIYTMNTRIKNLKFRLKFQDKARDKGKVSSH